MAGPVRPGKPDTQAHCRCLVDRRATAFTTCLIPAQRGVRSTTCPGAAKFLKQRIGPDEAAIVAGTIQVLRRVAVA
jgi:hypothetical protein